VLGMTGVERCMGQVKISSLFINVNYSGGCGSLLSPQRWYSWCQNCARGRGYPSRLRCKSGCRGLGVVSISTQTPMCSAVTLRLVQEVAVLAARVSRDVVAHAADSGSPGFNERRRRWTPLSAISGGARV
jgi:hypothetical protein